MILLKKNYVGLYSDILTYLQTDFFRNWFDGNDH